MRIVLSVLGLLVVVAIVGWLARQQLAVHVAPATPGAAASSPRDARQIQQQYQQALEKALQQPRPTGDEPAAEPAKAP